MMTEKWFLEAEQTTLLIIDMQDRLAAVMPERDRVVRNTGHLIALAKMIGVPVLVSEQYPKGLGTTVPEIRESLPAYRPFAKMTFDCCAAPAFREALHDLKRGTVLVTGMETHICVLQTCLGLLREGSMVHVVQDAVCSRTRENRDIGIEFMRGAGAVVTSTETALFQLLRAAGTEEFKKISRRIK